MLAAAVMLPPVIWAAWAWHSYDKALDGARVQAEQRVKLVADYAARTLEAVAMAMTLADRETSVLTETQVASSDAVSRLLTNRIEDADAIGQLIILDRNGIVVVASRGAGAPGANLSDREYVHGARATDGVYVGAQDLGRYSGQPFFPLARRRADGGVVVVALYTRGFEQMFKVAAGGEAATVALYRADGSQLARHPHLSQPAHLPSDAGLLRSILFADSGSYRMKAVHTDGKDRIYGYHRVGNFPIYATFGVSVDGVANAWRRDMAGNAGLALACSVVLGLAAGRFVRRERQRAQAEAHLQRLVEDRTAEADAAMRAREIALRQAELAHRSKSHFLAAASHDLRQPIQGLRLFVDVLAGRLAGTEHARPAEMAAQALEGAEQLLEALLDVSTLDAGMVRVERQNFPIDEALAPLAEEAGALAAAKGLDFRWVRCRQRVDGDPLLLKRMVRNLLVNAVRYTERGRIVLGCRRRGIAVRIEVWDSGSGIPADALDLVFEDFVQLGNPQRDRRKGLGLGLSVVRRMATLLGHGLDVRSEAGRGSMFAVVMPTAAAVRERLPAPVPG